MARTILIITGDAGESFETLYAWQRLLEAGFTPRIAAPSKRRLNLVIHDFEPGWDTYIEKPGYAAESDLTFDDVRIEDYEAVLVLGGRAPEYLRHDQRVLDIVRGFDAAQKWVFAICHGVQILAAADLIKGKRVTAYEHCRWEIQAAGGDYIPPIRPSATAASSPARPGSRTRSSIGSCSMPGVTATPHASMDDLQFERAEFGAASPARSCTGCHQPIAGDYFDVNGQPFCEACTASIRQAHGDGPGGAAFGRALGAGLIAGAVGSTLYYLVAKISGYQLSIIAIAVGFLVGRAVRWATGGRGGVIYQVLAVAVTYAAIAFSWVPFLVEQEAGSPGVLDVVLQTPFILTLPIAIGVERPFSLVILGIGLWEAWKFTAPVPLAINGPVRGRGARRGGVPAPGPPDARPMTFPPPIPESARARCRQCGADIPPTAVSCPACHALIHAEQLKSLAAAARAAAERGDVSGQLEAWRVALTLLPPESSQFRTISDRVQALSRSLSDPASAPPPEPAADGERRRRGAAARSPPRRC